jgi:phosphate transport system protein
MLGDDLRPDERRELVAVLRMATDLERVADLAEEIALICREVSPPHPPRIAQRLDKLTELTSRMLATALQAFAERDLQALTRLRESEDTVDVAQRWLHAEVLRHLRAMPGDMKVGVGLLFISHSLGRVADHATNIGESVIYAATGQLGRLRNYRPTNYPACLLPLV